MDSKYIEVIKMLSIFSIGYWLLIGRIILEYYNKNKEWPNELKIKMKFFIKLYLIIPITVIFCAYLWIF